MAHEDLAVHVGAGTDPDHGHLHALGDLAREVAESVQVPVIGIGAGPDVDGQILVSHDMLGLYTRFQPRFVRRYASIADDMRAAFGRYAEDVRGAAFPTPDESY